MNHLWGVVGCFVLILGISVLSLIKHHDLHKDFLIGALRTTLQLLVLGYTLTYMFRFESFWILTLATLFMTLNSAYQSALRVSLKSKSLFLDNLFSTAIVIWPLAVIGSLFTSDGSWWRMDVLLPLLGMLLGNTLNGISLGINFFGNEIRSRKDEVFSLLALGATNEEATTDILNRSLKMALTPTMNSMMSMGLVSIPGMMTGQILSGASPQAASVIQVMIILLITVGTYLGTYLAISLYRRHKFNSMGIPCFE